MINANQQSSRRHFLQLTGAAAASVACATSAPILARGAEPAPAKSITLGVTSYSFRKLKLDQALTVCKKVGLTHISLKSVHLPLNAKPDEIDTVVKSIKAAGMTLYGGGVITLTKDDEVNQAFEYAKAAGMKTINIAPKPEMLPLINQKIQQYDIRAAIHNHGPTDKYYPTPQSAYEKIAGFDKRFGLCIDIGHTVRIGANLIESVEKYADRLFDIHMKDVTEAAAKAKEIQVGRGVIDIPGFLKALVKVAYAEVVSFEYELDADDPLPGLAESVGFTRGVLTSMGIKIL